MKKILVLILCLSVAFGAFTACSKGETDKKETTTKASNEMTTDSAVIKEADAINLIESYSDKELGVTAKQRKEASFMVASDGTKIDNKNYIQVIATIKEEHKDGDKVTYTFNNLGEYYIRYDGKKIMRKDMDSTDAKYIDMKIKAVPSTTVVNVEAETKSEKEKTQETKKEKKDE